MSQKINKTSDAPHSLRNARGPLPVSMTNDYLFRALMQENKTALSALICALLYLQPDDVTYLDILNPIVPGNTIRDKEYILDVKLELNKRILINLEMQVLDSDNWPERSLCYLSRNFGSLNRGDDYRDVRPAIQIGILNFTPFEDSPAFLSNYYVMNTKNHKIYSDKFRLIVLDLTQENLATEEDRAYAANLWAALFKAATWEELKMLAKSNSGIREAVATIHKLTSTEKIRLKCEAREEYHRRMRTIIRDAKESKAALAQKVAENSRLSAERDQLSAEKEQLAAERDHLLQILAQNGIDISKDA